AFFPAPPKYEDVMRAKEEESLEGGSTPPRYSIQSSLASTVTSSDGGSESPLSEHDAPPDYSTMARPATVHRTRRITVAKASIDGPEEVVVVHTSGRDNHAYAGDSSDAPSTSSSSSSVAHSPRSARSLAPSDRRESARNGGETTQRRNGETQRRDGARPVVLAVETLQDDAEWEVARC
ncbi:hypothetical protein PRIPAC_74607, partial [Pristionchus pacificus]|uniref:Uncharacterized protein n=1 Tax=Pristionchus pacificus TaxID=54126 RepID=A0A2A6C6L7_PRIPA